MAALLKVLSAMRRLGGAAEAAEEAGKLERFFTALAKLALLGDEAAATRALRLLPQEHLSELTRLARFIEVPAGANAETLRAAANAKNAMPDVQRLADALSLARRFERRLQPIGAVTQDMSAALRKLLDTGWQRRTLADLVDAVPAERLGEWSRALSLLRPDQIEHLGAASLQALAYWPRSLSFVAETGGDVYLTLLRRYGGHTRSVEGLLHGLELRKAEIGDPAAYQRLLDAGELPEGENTDLEGDGGAHARATA